MISYDEVLNMNYYKKTSFDGWTGGMRFRICRETAGDETAFFHAWVWPGPYIFDLTDDALKSDQTFPFTEEGRRQAVDWLNEQYETNPERWPKKKISC